MNAGCRVDAELREHQHVITNAFTQEELAGLGRKSMVCVVLRWKY